MNVPRDRALALSRGYLIDHVTTRNRPGKGQNCTLHGLTVQKRTRPTLEGMLSRETLGLLWLLAGWVGEGRATYAYTFCMVTAARPNSVSYLERVVKIYREQHVFGRDGVGLAVIDADGWTARRSHKGLVHGFRLPNRGRALCDESIPDVEGIPSCKVRQRALDVVGALSVCSNKTSGWVILVEDDCEPCAGALSESLEALAGLDPRSVSMARLSVNMCATGFPRERVKAYSQSTLARLYTHPHDIIDVNLWAPVDTTRVYRHHRNLWHHIGEISTEPHKNDPKWREKYRAWRDDTCFDPIATG